MKCFLEVGGMVSPVLSVMASNPDMEAASETRVWRDMTLSLSPPKT